MRHKCYRARKPAGRSVTERDRLEGGVIQRETCWRKECYLQKQYEWRSVTERYSFERGVLQIETS